MNDTQRTLVGLLGVALSKHVLAAVVSRLARSRKQLVGRVSRLVLYPVKSCGGVEIESGYLNWTGVEHDGFKDRSWLLTSADSDAPLHQIMTPKLALIQTSLRGDVLQLDAPNKDTITLPRDAPSDCPEPKEYKFIRGKTADGVDCGDEVAVWLSEFVGRNVRLVRVTANTKTMKYADDTAYKSVYRPSDKGYFQFSTPHNIMSEASIEDLNVRRASTSVDWRNFRANIMVEGCEAYDEDNWEKIFIGDAELVRIKLCTRCQIINTNQETGGRHEGESAPLKTLQSYRLFGHLGYRKNAPSLGVHIGIDKCGHVKVGDPVYAIRNPPGRVQLNL